MVKSFFLSALIGIVLSGLLGMGNFLHAQDQDTSSHNSELSIPPEVLRQLQSPVDQPQTVVVAIPRLSITGRLILITLAVIVLFASVITCRFVSYRNYIRQINLYLLLGLFGAIAVLLLAAACVGSLYLHVAATLCTMTSGFCLMAFLLPQFGFVRRWVTGSPRQTDPNSNDNGEST